MPTSTAAPTPERRGCAAGFTLLEVAVTVGVLALVATLIGPRLAARGGHTLRLAADDAALRLTAARWRAVVEGRPVRVRLDRLAPGLRAVRPDTGSGAPPVVEFHPVPAAVPRTIELADGAGASARIVIPGGLAPLEIEAGDSP